MIFEYVKVKESCGNTCNLQSLKGAYHYHLIFRENTSFTLEVYRKIASCHRN